MNTNRRASWIMEILSSSIDWITFYRKRTVIRGFSIFSGVPAIIILFFSFLSLGSAYTFHGCAMAPNSDQGWVGTVNPPLVFHTSDGGVHWQEQYVPTTRDFYDIFFLDTLKGWTANSVGMIWHTSDGGATWQWQSLGGSKMSYRVFFHDSLFGWVATHAAILMRTTDGGNYWTQVIVYWLPADTVDFHGISFVDSLKGWMCAGQYPKEWGGDTIIFKKGQGFIVRSEDGGDSWVLQKRDTIYDFFDIKFKDSLEGWVAGGYDSTMEACVYHTTDGGRTWFLLILPQGSKIINSLELIDGTKLWAVGKNGTIIHSSDGGNSWVMQISGVDTTLYDVDFADSLRGIIAGDGVVLYTRDGGNTWFQANIVGIGSPETQRQKYQITAYPNPFSKQIILSYTPDVLSINLKIYDVTGKIVKSFFTNNQPLTTNNYFVWNGTDDNGSLLSPGIYFARFLIEGKTLTHKIIRLEK
jgi:photosystem II stability/assembly factor-like uncharacterized protein